MDRWTREQPSAAGAEGVMLLGAEEQGAAKEPGQPQRGRVGVLARVCSTLCTVIVKNLGLSSGLKLGTAPPRGCSGSPGGSAVVAWSGWVQLLGVGATTLIYPILQICPQALEAPEAGGVAVARLVGAGRF